MSEQELAEIREAAEADDGYLHGHLTTQDWGRDAEIATSATANVLRLLAEVERLRAEVERDRGAYETLRDAVIERLNPQDDDIAEPEIMATAIADAGAENAALREALTALLRDVERRSTWSVAGAVASVDRARALLGETQTQKAAPQTGRSTPAEFRDTAHVWDSRGQLWCYSEPCDTWTMRDQPTPAALTVPTSARSYQRLVAEFGPLRPMDTKASEE